MVSYDSMGIDVNTPLAQRCAEFYVLERMFSELHPYINDAYPTGALPLGTEFGRGGRQEMRAYSVRLTFLKLEEEMADLFVRYISMVSGGEMRYLWTYRGNRLMRESKREDPDYKNMRILYYSPDAEPSKCRAPESHAEEGHNYKCYGGEKAADRDIHGDDLLDGYMLEFFAKLGEYTGERGSRTSAWQDWWQVAGDPTPEVMQSLADAFIHPWWFSTHGPNRPITAYSDTQTPVVMPQQRARYDSGELKLKAMYSTSCGGFNWALPAEYAAMYLRGEMTRRSFVDRCWSIQHNGGSLFNKIWGTGTLQRMLEIQHGNQYHTLAAYSDTYIQQLYKEQYLQPGETLGKVKLKESDGSINSDNYCACCYWYYSETGDQDPCSTYSGGNYVEPNEGCYFYDKWTHQDTSYDSGEGHDSTEGVHNCPMCADGCDCEQCDHEHDMCSKCTQCLVCIPHKHNAPGEYALIDPSTWSTANTTTTTMTVPSGAMITGAKHTMCLTCEQCVECGACKCETPPCGSSDWHNSHVCSCYANGTDGGDTDGSDASTDD